MTESGTITSGTQFRDGFWGTVGWTYPGLGLAALVGVAFAGPSAIEAWEPWEHLGRMTFGVSAALAVGGGALALCVGWAMETRKRRADLSEASQSVATEGADPGPRERESDLEQTEAVDPTSRHLGRLASRRIVLWVLIGILCCAMGMLGEVSRKRSNRLPVGTKTGDAVPSEIWAAAMVAAALMVAGLVMLCLVEDRVRRTAQRGWLRAQLHEPMRPAKQTLRFYRGRSTPHTSRACALLATPLVTAGTAILVVGSVELGEAFAGSTAAYADLRAWGIVAVVIGLLLLALGVARATRWHRQNSDLRAELLERWPIEPAASAASSESGKG